MVSIIFYAIRTLITVYAGQHVVRGEMILDCPVMIAGR